MGTLINPHRPSPQVEADFYTEPYYLRNPNTGMIFKVFHKDTVARLISERYMPSTEEAMRAQSVELAELQGRPLPAWAKPEEKPSESTPAKAK